VRDQPLHALRSQPAFLSHPKKQRQFQSLCRTERSLHRAKM
jgi:hypothetical protein